MIVFALGFLTACRSDPGQQVYKSRTTYLVPRPAAGTSAVIDAAAAVLVGESCRIEARDDHALTAKAGSWETIAITVSAADRTFKTEGIVEGYDAIDVTIDLSSHFQLPVTKHPSWRGTQGASESAERLRMLLIQRILPPP
jgi:hypothetical protein